MYSSHHQNLNIDQPLIVGARSSKLSKIQVAEVFDELKQFFQVDYIPMWLETQGDKDQKTSLRSLHKCNFFTKEVDEALLNRDCRIGIHSAKDLPDPLPKGIVMVALTRGVDSSDSLVFRDGDTIESLKSGSTIATSSKKREENVKLLRSDLQFCDVRGAVDTRLEQLDNKLFDGLVVAEAAMIRLNQTHWNRIRLPGTTTEFQGQLAILARADDREMQQLFSFIDSRMSTIK
ncbi:MAG: hydroxymethylbilane synthase [Parachlamydiales bacterium]|nr:hydroxymethylbilane synthase [Parachlamydiales bacterium]